MLELPLIFIAGILGSSHCIGMCGGFALTVGTGSRSWRDNLARQSLYTLGRVFTYAVLGATAGFAGWRIARAFPSLVQLPAWLAIAAGLLLVYQGLSACGLFRRSVVTSTSGPCLASSFFSSFLRSGGRANAFLAGLFTGLLPCGLLYGMLALAATTRDLGLGLLVMTVFGLGTAPVMIATGWGGSLLGLAARKQLFRAAAICLVLTGAITVARGVGFLTSTERDPPACPFCLVRR